MKQHSVFTFSSPLFIFLLLFTSPPLAHSKSSAPQNKKEFVTLIEITAEVPHGTHTYQLLRIPGETIQHELILVDEHKERISRAVSNTYAYQIQRTVNQFIWDNHRYNTKNNNKFRCRKYVRYVAGIDNTEVCLQNIQMTGRSFGFLNSLHKEFKNSKN